MTCSLVIQKRKKEEKGKGHVVEEEDPQETASLALAVFECL